MKIAVLFDGAGLARLGLERAGHVCTGYELDKWKHHLGTFVGSGNTVLGDARDVDLVAGGFDAVWASPPCQTHSKGRNFGWGTKAGQGDEGNLLEWCIDNLIGRVPVVWIENVLNFGDRKNSWGKRWNAAQFLEVPLQSRPRLIGGTYRWPEPFREFKYMHTYLCPTITATEYKGGPSDTRRASRYYGRKLTLAECGYHQGFKVPKGWAAMPDDFEPHQQPSRWKQVQYEAIGNGVPVYMAQAFGAMYPPDEVVEFPLSSIALEGSVG